MNKQKDCRTEVEEKLNIINGGVTIVLVLQLITMLLITSS